MRLLKVSPLFALLTRDVLAAKNGYCPPLGPALPAATNLSSNLVVQQTLALLRGALDLYAVALFDGTAVSVGVRSIHEATPLVDIHYQSPDLDPRGMKQINASTVYRVGSVSKLFTVLAALKTEGVRTVDPITKYLPRLKELKKREGSTEDELVTVDLDDITPQTLPSHMSGIGPDYFWGNFGKRDPTFASYTTPILVIESKNILDPVGMTITSLAKPDDKFGAICLNDTIWDEVLGINDPAGGFYSSMEDLLTFGEAILTYKLFSPSLIPNYDLAVSILSLLVMQLLLSAIEDVSTYRDEQSDSSITLAVDDYGPGLSVGDWIVRGEDVRGHRPRYLISTTEDTGGMYALMRLYRSGLSTGSRTTWRAVAQLAMSEQLAQMEALLSWPQTVYEFGTLDEIVINLIDTDAGSTAASVDLVGFRATLRKTT
ncbi:beta-lactamase/transpeptidase-like protein [Daldinia decipiens]|uniref:beta-lactamase/transpeptidase-like protein n=1 Tax=Daldinia decipiens TaxID=326647 RepID=UPI0020C46625|nr:beta-lactamase/transpeptidase-like protein [Daldinia decipiens]KAI1653369.1 beta-lactamase/transpeptidase-like protein [Daldinia decipiens]